MSQPTGPRHGTDARRGRQTAASATGRAISGKSTILRPSDKPPAVTTNLLITLCAVLGLLVMLLAVLLVTRLRRSKREAETRVSGVVETLERRMDELATELAGAVARAEEEGRRSRFLGEIAGSIDLDDVVARTLEAAMEATNGDAALLCLEAQGDGPPLLEGHGLSADGAETIG